MLPTNLADLFDRLGNVPPERIRLQPRFGDATVADVIDLADSIDKRYCELIDGVLAEKAPSFQASVLTGWIGYAVMSYLNENNLGIALGASGAYEVFPDRVRIPDVSFVAWEKFPGGIIPEEAIPRLVPDLVVEVLAHGNTEREMELKRLDFFEHGTKQFWMVDPASQTAQVFASAIDFASIPIDGFIEGGTLFPGFRLSLRKLFDRLRRPVKPTA